MSLSIAACPKCSTLILDDTALCPSCHYVLKEGADHLAEIYSQADNKYDGSKDISCRECKAMNRDGLVRCWKCSAFLREEIEHAYQEMKAHPVQAVLVKPKTDSTPSEQDAPAPFSPPDSDDDFELADEIDFFQADQDWDATPEQEANNAIQETQSGNDNTTAREEISEDVEEKDKDLFDLAVGEKKESDSKAKKRKRKPAHKSFLVKCPTCTNNIRVQNYHQGQIGKCPKCSMPFMVPMLVPSKKKRGKRKNEKQNAGVASVPESQLITSVNWHQIDRKKFKPKVNMLVGKGENIDLIRRDEGLLIVWAEKKGMMGVSEAQTEKSRSEIAAHLLAGKPLEKLPATRSELIPTELLQKIQLVAPVLETVDSESTSEENQEEDENADITAGVSVFGKQAIAMQLPVLPVIIDEQAEALAQAKLNQGKKKKKARKKKVKPPAAPPVWSVSLTISQYRKLQKWLEEMTARASFLTHAELPLQDITKQWKCEFSDVEFEALTAADYYQEDPAIETTAVGWACQCGEVAISEQARIDQKFGGKKPAGLAKAKCLKCEQSFGQHPLFHLTSVVAPVPVVEPEKENNEKKTTSSNAEKTPKDSKKKPTKKLSLTGMFSKTKKSPDTK